MGPIEHAVCQIAFKIEKKYQDNEFKDQGLSIASSIHSVEIARKDWETNKDLKIIEVNMKFIIVEEERLSKF